MEYGGQNSFSPGQIQRSPKGGKRHNYEEKERECENHLLLLFPEGNREEVQLHTRRYFPERWEVGNEERAAAMTEWLKKKLDHKRGYLRSSQKNCNPTRHMCYIQPKKRTKIRPPDTEQATSVAKPKL